jgi:hypothetical protein
LGGAHAGALPGWGPAGGAAGIIGWPGAGGGAGAAPAVAVVSPRALAASPPATAAPTMIYFNLIGANSNRGRSNMRSTPWITRSASGKRWATQPSPMAAATACAINRTASLRSMAASI